MPTCTECNSAFTPAQSTDRSHPQTTCGLPTCQRARKTRLQALRRAANASTKPPKPLPHRAIYNHEAPASNRYSVIQSHRDPTATAETIVASSLTWAEATTCSETLQKQWMDTHPEQDSWTADVFYRQLEAQPQPHTATE